MYLFAPDGKYPLELSDLYHNAPAYEFKLFEFIFGKAAVIFAMLIAPEAGHGVIDDTLVLQRDQLIL